MTDTTQQPATEPERKRLNVFELLTNARGALQAAAALTTALLAFAGGQAVTEDKAAAALDGQSTGQHQAAMAVEAALERAMPKAMAPVTAELAAVKSQLNVLTIRVWAVENGVPLPASATATDLPVIRPSSANRQHRITRRATR
jgi:hypothetical protein